MQVNMLYKLFKRIRPGMNIFSIKNIPGGFYMRGLNFRIILGLVILIAGVLWLLQDFNLIDTAALNLWSYWPLIPLIVGLDWLVLSFRTSGSSSGKRVFFSWGQFVSALIMMGIGVLYLGRNMGLIDAAIVNRFWQILLPVLLIFLGFSLLRKRCSGRGSNRLAFMGGVDIGQKSWKLESGNYLAFMGGIKLDLTRAEIGREEIILDLTAFMGGIDVKIPGNLPVIYEGNAFLGGVSFLDQEEGGIIASQKIEYNVDAGDHRLVRIQARSVMGGIEIKEGPN